MTKLLNFPTVRTTVGTLLAVGFTPQQDNTAYRAFATFEYNGRLVSYNVESVGDFSHLTAILGNSVRTNSLFSGSLQRRDIAIMSYAGLTPVPTNQTTTLDCYDIDGTVYTWIANNTQPIVPTPPPPPPPHPSQRFFQEEEDDLV